MSHGAALCVKRTLPAARPRATLPANNRPEDAMTRHAAPILPLLLALAAPALAQPMLSLPLAPDATMTSVTHDCDDGRQVAATYVTSGDDALALVTLEDGPRIFVNVIAASGARYVSGALEWWTKGDQVTFIDAMSDADPVTCTARP
ncbi:MULTISPECIES: MliC family protein [Paracoccus]|uniref:C-type lysozyme inhibitor domain-containing protein n=1 Tax=Paracoccus haeundaensis TaxID=225362 RepID=A0A5C4R452_9RHOB|nr:MULTISPECIES: MliC family protein [Paracoccus]QXI62648.1 Membrane-bound lysozyme inhibitor of C-type lysozyme [Paracoccus marcusii]TNH38716.1 hypothetical protein FHD67_13285 [Paracoccus haeundaensis]